MGKINVLDKQIAELIAAGEVVERPSSVIKELLENAIDAGADTVTVEIKNGGISYMRVTDNGCGIMRDDVKTAFLRHATSKVSTQTDLDSIHTLGFRGEALASICAVSKVELLTRSSDEEAGTLYKISGSEQEELLDAGCPVGTTIIVRDLFYNVPARMKFLKRDISEGNAVSAVMDKIALSHPEISFVYIKDGRQMLKSPGDGNLQAASYAVYGRDFANSLIPVSYELDGVSVRGYVSKPEAARPNRNMQNFFINGRYIKCRTASAALEEASKGSVMVGKFLSCVLHIQISCSLVDVNVHPAKIEVRFVNERPIFDAVYHAVQLSLLRFDERKQIELNAVGAKKPFKTVESTISAEPLKTAENTAALSHKAFTSFPSSARPVGGSLSDSFVAPIIKSKGAYDENITIEVEDEPKESQEKAYNEKIISEKPNAAQDREEDLDSQSRIRLVTDDGKPKFRYIGEAFKTYIIVEKPPSEIVLIDKHAAHERIIYEQLKNTPDLIFEQGLIAPIMVTLDKTDYNSVINNKETFRRICFDVDDFGSGTVVVRSAPQFLENTDIASAVMEIAGFLSENKRDLNTEKMDWIFHSVACRAAVKAGNINSDKELEELAKKVIEDESLRYCPHGRPICIVLTKRELEKQFGRV